MSDRSTRSMLSVGRNLEQLSVHSIFRNQIQGSVEIDKARVEFNNYYSSDGRIGQFMSSRDGASIYICKAAWVSSFQGPALNRLRIGLWRPVLTTFWPIVGETPLWDPRHAFFPLFLLIWLPRHIYLGFSLHFYRGKFNNGYIYILNIYIYIYIARRCHTRGHKTILFRHSIFILLEGLFLKLVL